MPIRQPRRAGMVLATGQTTQYSSEQDDGLLEKGLAKAYTVLTAGQYASTVNIDLAHYAGGAGAIAFVAATKKVTDTGNGLAIFKTGDKIICTGPGEANNIAVLTVATGNVAGEIVVTEALTDETPAGAVTIKKREAHSNNCVLDLNTGLMWSRYASDKMGSTSAGTMPWTGQLYDSFAYAAAANAATLAGYTDWRIPNVLEVMGLLLFEAPSAVLDTTAFPSFGASVIWTSTTEPDNTANAYGPSTGDADAHPRDKTSARGVLLVRGG